MLVCQLSQWQLPGTVRNSTVAGYRILSYDQSIDTSLSELFIVNNLQRAEESLSAHFMKVPFQ